MTALLNLGSDKRSWIVPLAFWLSLTAIGGATYGLKVGSVFNALITLPLIAVMAAFVACWAVISFIAAHSSDEPIRRLLLTLFAVVVFLWSAWATVEIMSSTSSTAPVGLMFLIGWQGIAFVVVYLVARMLDWIFRSSGTKSAK